MPPAEMFPSSTGRPTLAEIDLEAFDHNLRLAARLGGQEREVMAVVKANAYGHGAVPVARAALRAGASCLGVATVAEARQLRRAGLRSPIVILSEVPLSSVPEVVQLECTQVLYSVELAEALEDAARRAARRVPVHLKVDTGMGRVGADPSEVKSLLSHLRKLPHLDFEGVLSHLADADRTDSDFTFDQLKAFHGVCRLLEEDGGGPRYRHIANSALLMRGEVAGNLTRPGIMLYGSPPAPGFPGAEALRPVMKFATAIAFVKKVPAGTPLSYGGTYVTRRESLIATLPVGYADGYPRLLSNRTEALVRGRRVPQVGRICMDMSLIDVTEMPDLAVGEEVVLMGRQGEERITAEELAALVGTISYEIYCAISYRVPRVPAGGEHTEATRDEDRPEDS